MLHLVTNLWENLTALSPQSNLRMCIQSKIWHSLYENRSQITTSALFGIHHPCGGADHWLSVDAFADDGSVVLTNQILL